MAASPEEYARKVAESIAGLPRRGKRQLIAVAGGPASGKSTLARALVDLLNASAEPAALLAMDGFHLDNAILDARGLRQRKGAPETFDLAGFRSLLMRLQEEDSLFGPSFDRTRDVSVGSSVYFGPEIGTVVVEGNYLLLDRPGWRDLSELWDFSVFVELEMEELRQRLMERWRGHGHSEADARARVEGNDLPNAETVRTERLPADMILTA